jgi:hypothetical protein
MGSAIGILSFNFALGAFNYAEARPALANANAKIADFTHKKPTDESANQASRRANVARIQLG